MLLKSGAIIDIYKNTNKPDTLIYQLLDSDLTHLYLKVNANSGVYYILHILNGPKIINTLQFIGSKNLTFNNLQPGIYKAVIYTDSNKNGVWDTGNIFTLKHPETITLTREFELRQNWDKELIINIK